jgi:hypothetical protein
MDGAWFDRRRRSCLQSRALQSRRRCASPATRSRRPVDRHVPPSPRPNARTERRRVVERGRARTAARSRRPLHATAKARRLARVPTIHWGALASASTVAGEPAGRRDRPGAIGRWRYCVSDVVLGYGCVRSCSGLCERGVVGGELLIVTGPPALEDRRLLDDLRRHRGARGPSRRGLRAARRDRRRWLSRVHVFSEAVYASVVSFVVSAEGADDGLRDQPWAAHRV